MEKTQALHKVISRKLRFGLIAQSSIGTVIVIGIIAYISSAANMLLLIPPIGATCFIVFVLPDSAFAQPRNVIAGHFFSGLIGLLSLYIFGYNWWCIAISAGIAVAIMQITHTNHPPAAATNILVTLQQVPDWQLLFGPILLCSIITTFIAVIYNRYLIKRNYPHYWW